MRPISQLLDEPIQCHSKWIMLNWIIFRSVRVPPLKIFWGSSRPMGSQHSELSTNEKPRFWPDSRCWPNLESTNPMLMCQLTDKQMFHDCQLNANGLPKECQLTSNWMPIEYQLNVNWLPIKCQLTSNWMKFDYQLDTNWLPMECQLTTN